MEAELLGFEKDEIHLDVQGDCLKLSAEHHADSEDKDEQKHYIRKERSDISYQRSFDLTGIDAEKLDAEYKNGILYVTLPKQQPEAPTSKRLEVK